MIEVCHLTKRFGKIKAVDDISFTVNAGEILGFLGPNGAGKSTTMNIITGYLSSNEGQVKIDGIDILENPYDAKKKLGYLPEHPPLYPEMTVRDFLLFVCDLKGVKKHRLEHIKEICEIVSLEQHFNRIIKNLSKGYRQRVGLALALIGNPDVLILDEPTVGLDPKEIIEIRNLIRNLGEKHTVILSSHILPEVQAVCDRIIVINNGKLIADDTPQNLSANLSKSNSIIVRIAGPEQKVLSALAKIPGVKKVISLGEKEVGSTDYRVDGEEGIEIRKPIFNVILSNSWSVLSLKSSEMTLEDIFLKLTEEDPADDDDTKEKTKQKKSWFKRKKKAEKTESDETDINADSSVDLDSDAAEDTGETLSIEVNAPEDSVATEDENKEQEEDE